METIDTTPKSQNEGQAVQIMFNTVIPDAEAFRRSQRELLEAIKGSLR